MKLGINGWRMVAAQTGVGRYLYNIVSNLTPERVADRFQAINLYTHRPLSRTTDPLPRNIRQQVLGPPWRMLVWENLRLGPLAGDDVVYHPSYSIPILRRGKSVVVIHEAVHEMYPHHFPRSVRLFYRHIYRWSAHHATLVISGSEAGKHDVAEQLGVSSDKIRTVPMAPAPFFRHRPDKAFAQDVQLKYLDEGMPYFLFVGKLSGRRNIPLLLSGFAAFKRETGLPHKLVMVGLNPHHVDMAKLQAEAGLSDEVVYPGYVHDLELNALYHATTALVSPAEYEPICLPVMEAQAAGAPVICTESAGMRETTGGHALMLPRLDSDELATALTRIARDPALARELAHQGRIYSTRFSWEKSADLTLNVLTEAAVA